MTPILLEYQHFLNTMIQEGPHWDAIRNNGKNMVAGAKADAQNILQHHPEDKTVQHLASKILKALDNNPKHYDAVEAAHDELADYISSRVGHETKDKKK